MYTLRWVGANTDPDIFEYVFGSKRIPPVGANRGHYRNAELDLLLDRARVEMDQAKRKEILARVQEIVATDEPYINLWYVDNIWVHRDRLGGGALFSLGDYDFLFWAFLKWARGARQASPRAFCRHALGFDETGGEPPHSKMIPVAQQSY